MRVKIGSLRLGLGFSAAVVMVCLINFGSPVLYCCGFLGILIHELTHLFFMLLFGCHSCEIAVLPGGIRIDAPSFELLSPRQAAICLLSAPSVNLLIGFVLFLISPSASHFDDVPAQINMTLGLANLIPLSFLDGGRAIGYLISSEMNESPGAHTVCWIDYLCLSMLVASAVLLALMKKHSLSYDLFVLYCAFCVFACKKKEGCFL